MKKALAIVLASTMAISLAACGGSSTATTTAAPATEAPKTAETTAAAAQETKAAAETSAEPVTLKIAHGAAESYHLHRALLVMKDFLEDSGLFKVEIYPNQQFGSDDEMIEGVQTGDLEICCPPSSFLADMVDRMSLIELPYVFPTREAALETLKGPWGQKAIDDPGQIGLHGFCFMENGSRNITNNKHEIRVPEDMKGLKMRTMTVTAHVKYWNSLGCSAEGSAFSELYTNLSTGVYDGQENPIAHIYANKFYEVQHYITMSAHVYCAYIPLCTTDFWDSLSAEQQATLTEGFQKAYDAQMAMISEETDAQLAEIQEYGCEVTYLTPEEIALWQESAQPILVEYKDKVGADVYDEFTKAVEDAYASL